MRKKLLKRICSIVTAGALLLLGQSVSIAAESNTTTLETQANQIENGVAGYDNNGQMIQGHGGNMLTYGDTYYWVGENKSANDSNFHGISLYSSKNLADWTYLNDIITPDTTAPEYMDYGVDEETGEKKQIEYATDTLGFCTVERPKLIYSKELNKFVLWAHWENGKDYGQSMLLVAVSDTIDGDYEVVKLFRPAGNRSLDFTIFVDEVNNQAYIISACGHTMYVYPLTSDYTGVIEDKSYAIFEDVGREAPALVKAGDYYVLLTSGQSGWYPNQTKYAYTRDISNSEGWSDLYYTGNNTTWYSQPTNIAVVKDSKGNDQYIYMGDRWNASALGTSTYVWLPLDISVNDTGVSVDLNYVGEWSLDLQSGSIQVPEYELVSEGKLVTASTENSKHPASDAVDGVIINTSTWGDNTNFFQPTEVPYTWEVDLEEMYALARIDISFRAYNGSEGYAQYTVEGSNDEKKWTKLADASSNKTVGFKSHAISGDYRYVRINCSAVYNAHNNNEAAWAAGLVEVQVYAAGETDGYTRLHNFYEQYKDMKQGYYTDESYEALQQALKEAKTLLEDTGKTEETYRDAYENLKQAVAQLAVIESVPVKITGSLETIVTYVNKMPNLPKTVEAQTQSGETIDAEIDWSEVETDDFSQAYDTVKVKGKIEGTELTVSQTVEVVPTGLVYFIDCNHSDSPAYKAVAAFTELANQVPDQEYTDDWGITSNGMTIHPKSSETDDKKQIGYYGDNNSHDTISYMLPLKETGKYDICVTSYEWWSGPRTLNCDVVYTNADKEQVQETIIEGLSVSGSSKNGEKTGSFTLDAPGTVELRFYKSAGTEAPVITFVGVSRSGASQPEEIEVGEGEANFTAPEKIENKDNTEFYSTVQIGSLEQDVKMIDAVLSVDTHLTVQDVTMNENVTGGSLNWYVEEGEQQNTLRLVYSDLTGNETLTTTEDMPCALVKITYVLEKAFEDLAEEQTVTVSLDSLQQYADSEHAVSYVKKSISKEIGVVAPENITVSTKVLYTGDGSDLIDAGEQAVKVVFTGIPEDYTGQITFSCDKAENIILYRSVDFTDRDGVVSYLMTVPEEVSRDELQNAENYQMTEEDAKAVTFGDTNEDDVIDAQDALNEVKAWLRKTTPEKDSPFVLIYNVTGDEKINSADALAVVEHFVSGKSWGVLAN